MPIFEALEKVWQAEQRESPETQSSQDKRHEALYSKKDCYNKKMSLIFDQEDDDQNNQLLSTAGNTQILNTEEQLRQVSIEAKKIHSSKVVSSPLSELKCNEIDELKKIFFEFFVREVLENKTIKSYEGPKYYEKNPDEKDFSENMDISLEEEMTKQFNTSLNTEIEDSD